MSEPSIATPATPVPAQIIPLGPQVPGIFANHIAIATDGISVFVTFSQATPLMATQVASGEVQKNAPMVALPVAKIVLAPKMLSQFIEGLQKMAGQIEQKQ